MAKGKAIRVTTLDVDFFDWNRYNLAHTTELNDWVKSFGQNVNEHFSVNGDNTGLLIQTPTGEKIDVNPGDVIIRDKESGKYFRTSATSFSEKYQITEENGIEVSDEK